MTEVDSKAKMVEQEDNTAPQDEESRAKDEEPSIWHSGPPAEAIQLSLSQGKLFLVWIFSDEDLWAPIWTDSDIKSLLTENAVCLMLEKESNDSAMFLQLIDSNPSAEGVWIVFEGQLLESFTEIPNVESAFQRMQSAVSQSETLRRQQSVSTSASTLPQSVVPSQSQDDRSEKIKAQLAARRARLETAKLQHDKVEREARKTAAARHASSTDPERQKYITQQARERAQQRSERAKILKEIENDKLERKLRAGREHELHHHVDSPGGSQLETGRDTTKMGERGTTISVRLPDSRAIRTEFDSRQTLADVRKWIDETRNDPSSAPYVLQTTFPTRTFELSEEHNETLESLLGKGGQVIMKEIKTYSDAYTQGPQGVVSMASSLLGSVTGTISGVLGWKSQPVPPAAPPLPDDERPGAAIREARIRNVNYSPRERGVRSDEDREKNWFNGNGLAQEAPPSTDDGKNQ